VGVFRFPICCLILRGKEAIREEALLRGLEQVVDLD